MIIEVPHWITRKFIQDHRELTFIYADDFKGYSFQGQSAHAAGEPNAFPIPTKCIGLCRREVAYFSDKDYDILEPKIDTYFDKIPMENPIIPFPRVGEGDSELSKRAPRLFKYIKKRLELIAYKQIKWV